MTTQFNTENANKHSLLAAAILLYGWNYYILMATFSKLEALFLDVLSGALNNCSF